MSSKKQSDKPEKQNLRMPKQNLPGKPQSAIPQAEAIGKPPNPQSAGGLGLAVNRPDKGIVFLFYKFSQTFDTRNVSQNIRWPWYSSSPWSRKKPWNQMHLKVVEDHPIE